MNGDQYVDSLIQIFLGISISQVDFSWELYSYAVLANCVPWLCQEERRKRYATARAKPGRNQILDEWVVLFRTHFLLRMSLTSLFWHVHFEHVKMPHPFLAPSIPLSLEFALKMHSTIRTRTQNIHSRKLTWHPKIDTWKRRFLLDPIGNHHLKVPC